MGWACGKVLLALMQHATTAMLSIRSAWDLLWSDQTSHIVPTELHMLCRKPVTCRVG